MTHSPTAQAHLIRAGRLKLGLTQKELAERLGVHEQTVAAFESGRKLATGAELIEQMAEVFGYHPDQLYAAARRIPPDMRAYIEHTPTLISGIRAHMDHLQGRQ